MVLCIVVSSMCGVCFVHSGSIVLLCLVCVEGVGMCVCSMLHVGLHGCVCVMYRVCLVCAWFNCVCCVLGMCI